MPLSIKYRPEIDGLRALAVIGIVIFHAKFSIGGNEYFLPGGFLGVDVFFVISGYLITSIIVGEDGAPYRVAHKYPYHKEIPFDNNLLQKHSVWKQKNEFKSEGKIKILLIGNSHSSDTRKMLSANTQLATNFEFVRLGGKKQNGEISCRQIDKIDLNVYAQAQIIRQSDLILWNV